MEQPISLNKGLELVKTQQQEKDIVCCPKCQSINLAKDGRNKKDGRQRYKCKECHRAFIPKLSFEEKHRKIKRDVACPRCGNHYLHEAGNNPNGKCYKCINCKMRFAEYPVVNILREKYECPICKTNETVSAGKNNTGEKQRFFCNKCQRGFTEKSTYIQLGRSRTQWNSIDEMFHSDLWDVRVLGLQPTISNKRSTLNFSAIKIEWLKQATKLWIKYRAALDETSTLAHKVGSINKFNKFLQNKNLNLSPQKVNRELIVDYLVYLNCLNLNPITVGTHIGNLNQLLQESSRHGWANVTKEILVFPEDYPKKVKRLPRFIPEDIIKQLEDNLDALAKPVQCMITVLRETGIRISELVLLELNCMRKDSTGTYWINIYQKKMKKEIPPLPIPRYAAELIYEQQGYIISKLGKDFPYLFCDTKNKSSFYLDKITRDNQDVVNIPLSYFESVPVRLDPQTLRGYLHRLAEENQIVDTTGKVFPLGRCHRFRHTHGTDLINAGVPQHIVQKRLGHASPEMTSVYAHVHDKTMKQEMSKFWDGRVVDNKGKVIVPENPDLDTADIQWIKRNMKAQALPDGFCGLPVTKSCPVQGSPCLSCSHLRTTIEFLDVHKKHLEDTEKLIENARQNGWDRQAETNLPIAENLKKIIRGLEQKEVVHGDESFPEQEGGKQSA